MQLKVLRPAADDDSFDMKFYRNNFSKQTIKILILIPIIPQNMFKLHTKKIFTKSKSLTFILFIMLAC